MIFRGKRTCKIAIEEPVYFKDPNTGGVSIIDWQPKHEVWAEFLESRGKEDVYSDIEQGELVGTYRIDFYDDITTTDRVSHRGKLYNIADVRNPKLQNKMLYLDCAEYQIADGR